MNTALRIALFAAAGWLAGELISRTLLAAPVSAASPSRVPALEERVVQRSEWQEFLTTHTPAAAAAPLTAAELSPKTLGTPDGLLAASRRMTTTPLDEFPNMMDSIAKIVDVRLRRQAAEALFATWAEKDPAAAMAAVNKYPSMAQAALQGTLRTWSERDPRALAAWLRTNIDSGGWARVQAELDAVPYLVARIPEETMNFAVEMHSRRNLLGTTFNAWHSKDPAAADAWMAATPPDIKKLLTKAIGEDRRAPMGAAQ
jgi:hypothetical protein